MTTTENTWTLTPAEAAQVAEKVIEIAQEKYGYGDKAREVLSEAIAAVRGDDTVTMAGEATSVPVSSTGEVTLEARVTRLEQIARANNLL